MGSRVIVLGIDGATFDLLLPWVEQGKLPNLQRALRQGSYGVLHSTIPPYSAQAWVSMMTGKNPGKHGVVDFVEQGEIRDRRGCASATVIEDESIWDIASRHHKQVGIVNVPLTYPPVPVNGYMVSGFLTPKGRQDYTYPSELREEILGVTGEYSPDPYEPLTTHQDLTNFLRWMRIAEQAALYLQRKQHVDLFVNVIQTLDHLQHIAWDALVDESIRSQPQWTKAWPVIEECYAAMDAAIGQRLDLLDEETTLFLVSDHGFQEATAWFNVNRWLAQLGFLHFVEGQIGAAKSVLTRMGLTRENMKAIVRRLDVLGLRRYVEAQTRAAIASKLGDAVALPIDWSRTVAYAGPRTSEGIYINLKGREPYGVVEPGRQYEEVRTSIMAALSALLDPDSGKPVTSAVHRREDIYSGKYAELLPDIVLSFDGRPYLPSDSTATMQALEPIPTGYVRGRHHSHGIFAAIGPGVRPGRLPEQAHIVDVTPTILHTLGLPIPGDMDGKVLEEAFTAEHRLAHPIGYEEPGHTIRRADRQQVTYTEEEQAQLESRLRDLGYMD